MFPFGVVRMISPTVGESALWRERFSAIRPPHTSGAPDGARAGEYAPLLISLTKERERERERDRERERQTERERERYIYIYISAYLCHSFVLVLVVPLV